MESSEEASKGEHGNLPMNIECIDPNNDYQESNDDEYQGEDEDNDADHGTKVKQTTKSKIGMDIYLQPIYS